MSLQLEQKVSELIVVSDDKKAVGRGLYQIEKQYKQLEDAVTSMLKAGHAMPAASLYFAQLADEETGRLNVHWVVDMFVERYPQYSSIVQQLKEESKHVVVEKLQYGTKGK